MIECWHWPFVPKGPSKLQLKLYSYRPYTLQLLFTTAKIFSTASYMGNDFHNHFFEKNRYENLCSVREPLFSFVLCIYVTILCSMVYKLKGTYHLASPGLVLR